MLCYSTHSVNFIENIVRYYSVEIVIVVNHQQEEKKNNNKKEKKQIETKNLPKVRA